MTKRRQSEDVQLVRSCNERWDSPFNQSHRSLTRNPIIFLAEYSNAK